MNRSTTKFASEPKLHAETHHLRKPRDTSPSRFFPIAVADLTNLLLMHEDGATAFPLTIEGAGKELHQMSSPHRLAAERLAMSASSAASASLPRGIPDTAGDPIDGGRPAGVDRPCDLVEVSTDRSHAIGKQAETVTPAARGRLQGTKLDRREADEPLCPSVSTLLNGC